MWGGGLYGIYILPFIVLLFSLDPDLSLFKSGFCKSVKLSGSLVGESYFQPAAAAPAAGVTRLGVEAKKETNLPDWYSQVSYISIFIAVYLSFFLSLPPFQSLCLSLSQSVFLPLFISSFITYFG